MLENTIAIAAFTCSKLDAFTTTTTDDSEKSQCLDDFQIDLTPEPTLEQQTQ